MQKRIGVIGIVIEDRTKGVQVNQILSQHVNLIIGRMGVPRISHNEQGLSVIALIIEGTTDEIGALTGKLGNIKNVQVRSALSSI